jgi:hypothetical protein
MSGWNLAVKDDIKVSGFLFQDFTRLAFGQIYCGGPDSGTVR